MNRVILYSIIVATAIFSSSTVGAHSGVMPEGWDMKTLYFPNCTVELPVPAEGPMQMKFSEADGRYERKYISIEASAAVVWGDMSLRNIFKDSGGGFYDISFNDSIYRSDYKTISTSSLSDTRYLYCYKVWRRLGLTVAIKVDFGQDELGHRLIDMVRVCPTFNRHNVLSDLMEPDTWWKECERTETVDGRKWFVFQPDVSRQEIERAYSVLKDSFCERVSCVSSFVSNNCHRYLEGMFQCYAYFKRSEKYMVVALWPTDLYKDVGELEQELSERFHSRLSQSRERIFVVTVNLTAGKIEKVEF